MGRAYDGKRRWNETVRQTAAALAASAARRGAAGSKAKAKPAARASGRAVRLSAAMKSVDLETRALVRSARLEALEADDHGLEAEEDAAAAGDELYVDEEPAGGAKGRRKAAPAAASAAKARRFKVKSLAQVVFEEFGDGGDGKPQGQEPTYLTVAAAPSVLPARKFCVVCGFFASYACQRCGSRFCRVKCGDHHKESGCLKFGL